MIFDYLNKYYSKTTELPAIFKKMKIDSILRYILIILANKFIRIGNQKNIQNNYSDRKIIVSLTSFPGRIKNVWKTINTIINQSYKPDKIILWLSEDQFSSMSDVPKKLRSLEIYGLEIRLVTGDLRSHKKYTYAFRDFPNDYILLVDDDILYPSDMIETLMKDMTPEKVHCSYGSVVRYGVDNRPLKYKKWQPVFDTYYGEEFFFGSGGGTLLMPSKLDQDVLDMDKALKLCPTADDIWLNTMCRLSGLKIEKVRSGLIFPTTLNDKQTLHKNNIGQNQNDIQIKNIIDAYPQAFYSKKGSPID